MWIDAKSGKANEGFRQVLMECEEYAPYIDHVMTKLSEPDYYMWYWEGQGFRLALSYKIDEHNVAYIRVCIPAPEGNVNQWSITFLNKLRVELDALGVDEWRSREVENYQSDHVREFTDSVNRISHEYQSEHIVNGKRYLVFKRKEENKKDDNKFEGIGKDRPPREKKPKRG